MNIYSRKLPPTGYYVYVYLRSKKSITADILTPYYIGKGSKIRAWEGHGKLPIPNNDHILIIATELTELWAYVLERRLIRWYGRKDNGTGILHNRTDGGDHPPNSKGKPSKNKGRKSPNISKAKKGKPAPWVSNAMKGRRWYNNGITNTLAKTCPVGYIEGCLSRPAQIGKPSGMLGKRWYNNGIQQVAADKCPDGYVLGNLYGKGTKWYNNGSVQIQADSWPDGYVLGTLNSDRHTGKRVFNNGQKNIKAFECPEGFVIGQLPPKIKKIKPKRNYYNNGFEQVLSDKCPEGYVLGMLFGGSIGKKWYNNGEIELVFDNCPIGFNPGRLPNEKLGIHTSLS